MRALFTNLPIAFLGLALLASCGKENASGGGSASLSTGVQVSGSTSLSGLRSAFNNTALNYGISEDTEVYHAGPYFQSASNSNCEDLEVFGFSLGSYCYNQFSSYEEQLMSAYEIKLVKTTSSGSLKYKVPTGTNSNSYGFTYGPEISFDRNSDRYKEMLGLNTSPIEVRVSDARIKLSNNQTKNGVYVEYFFGTKTNNVLNITHKDAFVLSTELPVIANPITVEKNGSYIGRLGKVGDVEAEEIRVLNSHYFTQEYDGSSFYPKSVIKSIGRERTL